jgi:hypothetical protein
MGRANARPDRAVLVFDVGHTAATPQGALQEVAARTTALAQVLRDRGVADADWTTTGVTVQPVYEWRKEERVFLGHRAANRVQVTTHDPEMVGTLFSAAVDTVSARVGGPQWIVEQTNPAHLEACRLAALDARQRAEAYAAGLGLALGPVVLADETIPDVPRPIGRAMMAMAVGDESAPIEVNAGELEVTADVRITFALVETA